MTACANGWRALTRKQCVTVPAPGGELYVAPRVAPIFADLAQRYHDTVEPLTWPGTWSWADRPIRTGTVKSNHAGYAVDFCAPRHPQGVPVSKTFTPAQLEAIWALERRYGGVIVWGGDWDLPDTDGMHWEIAAGTSVEAVDKLVAWLAGQSTTPPPPAPTPPPPTPAPAPAPPPAPAGPGWTGPDLAGQSVGLRGDEGNSGPRVQALQRWLRDTYPLYAKGLADDGWWGPQTSGVLAQYATRSGIRGADGRNIGPQIARKLYLSRFRG